MSTYQGSDRRRSHAGTRPAYSAVSFAGRTTAGDTGFIWITAVTAALWFTLGVMMIAAGWSALASIGLSWLGSNALTFVVAAGYFVLSDSQPRGKATVKPSYAA
ncbi:MAG: hypothetical protein AAF334_08060 [Pseudomonadota bacterium]